MEKPKWIILPTPQFKKDLKTLSKKYSSILEDVEKLYQTLLDDPIVGTSLGAGFYKIRMAITAKGKGKSGGGAGHY